MFKAKDAVDIAIDDIIKREGGFVNHPMDKGGPTNYGITLRTLSEWLDYPARLDDLKELDLKEVREIYYELYFENTGVYLLHEELQGFVLDSCVNHGPFNAIKMLQGVINQTGYKPVLTLDGIIGPQTAKASNWFHANAAVTVLISRRRMFYNDIVKRDQSQIVFRKGWFNRLDEIRDKLLK